MTKRMSIGLANLMDTVPVHQHLDDDGIDPILTHVELFNAIAHDQFFQTISKNHVELHGDDRSDRDISSEGLLMINVNNCHETKMGKTLLHQACRIANLQVVNCLLFHGANPSQVCTMGRTPFHETISSGKHDMILPILQVLYEHDPIGLMQVDQNGTHLVHLAAIHGCLDVLIWCRECIPSISLDITSFSGRNALHYAAYNGQHNILEWLLEPSNNSGLSIASLDINGYSVLHYAAMGGDLSICKWLVLQAPTRHELSLTATNYEGQTAYDLASRFPTLQMFLEDISQVPSPPTDIICIGSDQSSIGITWQWQVPQEYTSIADILSPVWWDIEYCRKPTTFRRASALLSMLSASAASLYLLKWEPLHSIRMACDAHEYWLSGLQSDCEYLIRIRARNRNGDGDFSIPDLLQEFKTSGVRQASLVLHGYVSPIYFIGTLELEIVEARRLVITEHGCNRRDVAESGQFYCMVTLEIPGEVPRRLYRTRSEVACVQQELVMSGSMHGIRHPRFDFSVKLRVPETLDAIVRIEIQHDGTTLGLIEMPLVEFVRGFPAKIMWLELHTSDTNPSPVGDVFVRSLFLADGMNELPHPTKPDRMCTTAIEMLEDHEITPYDALGFHLYPACPVAHHRSLPHKTNEYFRLHQACMARQQTHLWYQYHHSITQSKREDRTLRTILLTHEQDAILYEPSSCRNTHELQRLVWDGLPPDTRRVLYLRISGATKRRRAVSIDYYQQQLAIARATTPSISLDTIRRQIQVDLQRTFAGNACWINTDEGQQTMERILLTYAVHNPSIGYCQSMSLIVGRFLCLFYEDKDQEIEVNVFWLLVVLCEDYFPFYYTIGMKGLHIDSLVLETLVQQRLPKLARHFQLVLQNPVPMGLLLVTGWLLPIFCAHFPTETTFRIVDILLYEQSTVVFAVILALLRMVQPQLLETKDYMQVFRLLKQHDQQLQDTALLLEIVWEEHSCIHTWIPSLRQQYDHSG